LMAASGNAPLAPGRRSLGRVTPVAGASELLSYATGVDQHGSRFDLGTANVSVRVEPDPSAPPTMLRIGRPYPNPYVSATGAPITIPISGAGAGAEARLEVFDMLGRQVVRRSVAARSDGRVHWIPDDDGLSLVPGVYLIRVAVGTRTETRAVTVVR